MTSKPDDGEPLPLAVPHIVVNAVLAHLAAERQFKTLTNVGATCKSLHELVHSVLGRRVEWTYEDWQLHHDLRNGAGVPEAWARVEYLFLSADFHAMMDDARCIGFNEQDRTLPGYIASDMVSQFPSLRLFIHKAPKETAAPPSISRGFSPPPFNQWTVWLTCLHSRETALQDVGYALKTICAIPIPSRQTANIAFKYEVMPTLTIYHCTSTRNRFGSLAEYLDRKDSEVLADATIQITDDANIRFRLVQVNDDEDHFKRIYALFDTMNAIYRSKWKFTTTPFQLKVRDCAGSDVVEWLNVLAYTENRYPDTPLRYRMVFQLKQVGDEPPLRAFTTSMQQVHRQLITLHADPKVRNKLPNSITVGLDFVVPGIRIHPMRADFDLSNSTDFDTSLDRDYRGSGVTANTEEGVGMSLHGLSEEGLASGRFELEMPCRLLTLPSVLLKRILNHLQQEGEFKALAHLNVCSKRAFTASLSVLWREVHWTGQQWKRVQERSLKAKVIPAGWKEVKYIFLENESYNIDWFWTPLHSHQRGLNTHNSLAHNFFPELRFIATREIEKGKTQGCREFWVSSRNMIVKGDTNAFKKMLSVINSTSATKTTDKPLDLARVTDVYTTYAPIHSEVQYDANQPNLIKAIRALGMQNPTSSPFDEGDPDPNELPRLNRSEISLFAHDVGHISVYSLSEQGFSNRGRKGMKEIFLFFEHVNILCGGGSSGRLNLQIECYDFDVLDIWLDMMASLKAINTVEPARVPRYTLHVDISAPYTHTDFVATILDLQSTLDILLPASVKRDLTMLPSHMVVNINHDSLEVDTVDRALLELSSKESALLARIGTFLEYNNEWLRSSLYRQGRLVKQEHVQALTDRYGWLASTASGGEKTRFT
ncbi:hypothetical protein QFC22_004725 [Naganishia vaughanmartiniae]|uniref:Uncharacterized protein n=1 Tax=Naganishia vaughanmartiniae TaxID=1424756 RepID=A0ACC2WY83_9TREE|nr:hypothetical protein QFC22_004725 [Naganishia vaughanmartiniae]